MNRKFLSTLSAFVLVAAIGCGGAKQAEDEGSDDGESTESAESTEAPAAAPAEGAAPAAPAVAADAGTITGAIKLDGAAPKPEPIRMKADAYCDKSHAEGAMSEAVKVGTAGELANVFVYVKDYKGPKAAAPTAPVTLDQHGCLYTPHVFGVMAKQPIEILNSDDTLHNIHALPTTNSEFNIAMPTKGQKTQKVFDKPEVMVKFKCDVHPWMAAYAGVLDHPYFGVTDGTGKFTIANVPPGTYTVEAWHEVFGTQTMQVTVGAKESKTADFAFKPKA
jgi:hypothetical protein